MHITKRPKQPFALPDWMVQRTERVWKKWLRSLTVSEIFHLWGSFENELIWKQVRTYRRLTPTACVAQFKGMSVAQYMESVRELLGDEFAHFDTWLLLVPDKADLSNYHLYMVQLWTTEVWSEQCTLVGARGVFSN